MTTEITIFRDKQDLELELFTEFDDKEVYLQNFVNEDEVEKIFDSYASKLIRSLKEVDGRWIFSNNSDYFLSTDKLSMGIVVGDYFIFENDYSGAKFCKIEDYLKQEKDLLILSKELEKLNDYTADIEDYDVLNPKIITDILEKAKKSFEEQEDKRKKRLQESRDSREQIDLNTEFKKTGIVDLKYCKVDGNEIILKDGGDGSLNGNKYLLTKGKFKDYFDVSDLTFHYDVSIEKDLISKEISFSKYLPDDTGYKKVLELNFEGKTLFNGVAINKAKIGFILDRIKGDLSNKTLIERYNKLTGMKADLIDLEEIEIHKSGRNITVPIKISLTDFEDTLKIEIFGVEKDFSWNECKTFFFDDGKRRSVQGTFYTEELYKFTEKLGLEKGKLFQELKRVILVNSLGKENDS